MLVPLSPNSVSDGGDDRDGGCTEQIWYSLELSDQLSGGVSALHGIQLVCEKTRLEVPTTLLEAQKPLA